MTTNTTPAVERLREGLTIAEMLAHDVPLSLAASEKLRLAWFALDEVAALAPVSEPVAGSVEIMREALEWYAEHVAGCRKIGRIGDPFRHALDEDGGQRARAAVPPSKPDAPTLPEGMKPWHGGDAAPEDWDGGECLRSDRVTMLPSEGTDWQHKNDRYDIIAYTPVARPAATEGELEWLTRPIIGIENRSAQEAFDIMAALSTPSVSVTQPSGGEG